MRLTRLLALLSVPLLTLMLPAGIAEASDNSGRHICISGHTSQCLDLSNDSFTTDNYVWVFGTNGAGLGWQLHLDGYVCTGGSCGAVWPFPNGSGLNSKYSGRPVYTIEKTQGSTGTNGCLGEFSAPGPSYAASWETCDSTKSDLWVYASNQHLVSVNISSISANGAVYFSSWLSAACTQDKCSVIVAPDDPYYPYGTWVFT